MVKLTESAILSRTKTGTIETVKKLNCWGCDLDDISIIEGMPNLEVLSLSVNKITSLRPLASCVRLKELFLRGNCINSLSEIYHLRNLNELRVLWLAENPCSDEPDYRNVVLRTLPRLTTLDNRPVTPEEVSKCSESAVAPSLNEASMSQSQYSLAFSPACSDTLPSANIVSVDSNNCSFRYEHPSPPGSNSFYGNENGYNMSASFHRHSPPVEQSPFRESQIKDDSLYKRYSNYDLAAQQRSLVTLSDVYGSYHSQQLSSNSLKQESVRNVLSAVVLLLDELDDRSLSVVVQEAEKRMRRNV